MSCFILFFLHPQVFRITQIGQEQQLTRFKDIGYQDKETGCCGEILNGSGNKHLYGDKSSQDDAYFGRAEDARVDGVLPTNLVTELGGDHLPPVEHHKQEPGILPDAGSIDAESQPDKDGTYPVDRHIEREAVPLAWRTAVVSQPPVEGVPKPVDGEPNQ